MNELLQALQNVKIESSSAVDIAKWFFLKEILDVSIRGFAIVAFALTMAITIYKITKNYGTGKWKS